MITEWDQPAYLQTPSGNLPFNQPLGTDTDRWLLLNPRKCSSRLPVRVTDDDIPQGDGKIPHRRFRSGYGAHLAFELLSSYDPDTGESVTAAGADLVELEDLVGLHVNEMIRTSLFAGAPEARYVWTPSGQGDDRMLTRCQLAGDPVYSYDGDLGCSLYEIDIDTSLPYYIGATEAVEGLVDGETATVTNGGNTDYFPAVQVYGPCAGFTLANNSVVDADGNPLKLVYDSSLPGGNAIVAGNYVEFSFFLQTAYLNGNQANRKAGIDMRVSDFFPLVPGDNELELTLVGGDGTDSLAVVLSNPAWA